MIHHVRTLLFMVVAFATASTASAQTGHVEGRVTEGTKPLVYANAILLVHANGLLAGTDCDAMTDSSGFFRFRAPCGRYTLRVMHMGYRVSEVPVVIRRDETTRVSIVLEWVEVRRPQTIVPRWRPTSEDADQQQLVGRPVSDLLEAVGRRAGDPGAWNYRTSTEAVRHDDLELSMRYVLAEEGDSVVVNVVAEARNVSARTVIVCGCFSLWDTRYRGGPDDFSQVRFGPARTPSPGTILATLDVPPLECDGVFLNEERHALLPGESIARGMTFAFYPNAFREDTGELRVYGTFLTGQRGDRWEDATPIVLGIITVPIRPIGMPIRP
jgi:hypothetical protein